MMDRMRIMLTSAVLLLVIVLGIFVVAGNRVAFRNGPSSAPRAHVTCYSGGKLILEDYATSGIEVSDGGAYSFRSLATGQRIRTSADCVAVYGALPQAGFKAVRP